MPCPVLVIAQSPPSAPPAPLIRPLPHPLPPSSAERQGLGAPGPIRTADPQVRSLMLYPTELRERRRAIAMDGLDVAR